MITRQEIINNALLAFGNKTYIDVDIDNINRQYDLAVQKVLSKDFWTFAQVINNLGGVLNSSSQLGYKYMYYVPSDMCRLFKIFNNNIIDRDYTIIGNIIHSNLDAAKIQYTSINPLNSYPVHFADCVSYYLATLLCVTLGSPNSQGTLYNLYLEKLSEAHLLNSQDVPSPKYISNYYRRSRL